MKLSLLLLGVLSLHLDGRRSYEYEPVDTMVSSCICHDVCNSHLLRILVPMGNKRKRLRLHLRVRGGIDADLDIPSRQARVQVLWTAIVPQWQHFHDS